MYEKIIKINLKEIVLLKQEYTKKKGSFVEKVTEPNPIRHIFKNYDVIDIVDSRDPSELNLLIYKLTKDQIGIIRVFTDKDLNTKEISLYTYMLDEPIKENELIKFEIDYSDHHILFQDSAAGKMWITSIEYDNVWTYQELGRGHGIPICESFDRKEVEKCYDTLIMSSTKYVVFTEKDNDSQDCYWVEEMNCNSGTYQDIGGPHSSHIYESLDKSEAEDYIKNYC